MTCCVETEKMEEEYSLVLLELGLEGKIFCGVVKQRAKLVQYPDIKSSRVLVVSARTTHTK